LIIGVGDGGPFAYKVNRVDDGPKPEKLPERGLSGDETSYGAGEILDPLKG
jgi:hypothetical protein